MRVIQVCSARSVAGGEVHVAGLCRMLSEAGCDVHLFHRRNAAILRDFPDAFREKHAVAPRNAVDLPAVFRMARLILKLRADVVHAHMGRDWFPVALAVKLARVAGSRVRLVLTRHHLNRIRWNPLKWTAFAGDCRVIAVSHAVERSLWESSDFFRGKTSVINNWVRLPVPVASAGRTGPVVVACIGTISPIKDQLTFVRAAQRVKKRPDAPDTIFRVIGSPGDSARNTAYDSRVKAEAGDTVVFTSRIPHVAARMHEFDIVVVPSLSEAFPLVLVEAMIAGCAVVVSDTGGMPEIIDTPEVGRLFPVGDDRALADILDALAGDSALRAGLGAAAREAAKERYAPDRIRVQTLDVYAGGKETRA